MSEKCANCGREFEEGYGAPKGRFECCCSYTCWLKFQGLDEGEETIMLRGDNND